MIYAVYKEQRKPVIIRFDIWIHHNTSDKYITSLFWGLVKNNSAQTPAWLALFAVQLQNDLIPQTSHQQNTRKDTMRQLNLKPILGGTKSSKANSPSNGNFFKAEWLYPIIFWAASVVKILFSQRYRTKWWDSWCR